MKEKPVSFFPTRRVNSSPTAKIAILQRLLVSIPFSRLALSVQLYSQDAQEWWAASGEEVEKTSLKGASKAMARTSVKAIAEQVHLLKIQQAYGPITRPDLGGVQKMFRPEGVDGMRLFRETGEEAVAGPAIGAGKIEVDDGKWTDEHLLKWEQYEEQMGARSITDQATCSICSGSIGTTVSL